MIKSIEKVGREKILKARRKSRKEKPSAEFAWHLLNSVCQHDQVHLCFLSYLSKESLVFSEAKRFESLLVDFRAIKILFLDMITIHFVHRLSSQINTG